MKQNRLVDWLGSMRSAVADGKYGQDDGLDIDALSVDFDEILDELTEDDEDDE